MKRQDNHERKESRKKCPQNHLYWTIDIESYLGTSVERFNEWLLAIIEHVYQEGSRTDQWRE